MNKFLIAFCLFLTLYANLEPINFPLMQNSIYGRNENSSERFLEKKEDINLKIFENEKIKKLMKDFRSKIVQKLFKNEKISREDLKEFYEKFVQISIDENLMKELTKNEKDKIVKESIDQFENSMKKGNFDKNFLKGLFNSKDKKGESKNLRENRRENENSHNRENRNEKFSELGSGKEDGRKDHHHFPLIVFAIFGIGFLALVGFCVYRYKKKKNTVLSPQEDQNLVYSQKF